MSLNFEANRWVEEIRQDQDWLDRKLDKVKDMIAAYHGPGYGDENDINGYDPRNHAHQVVSLYAPDLAYDIPKARVGSLRTESNERMLAAHHALNRWLPETRFSALTDKLAVDYLFAFGGTVTTMQPVKGLYEFEDPLYWPQVARLPMKMMGWDRHAKSWEERRYSWHVVVTLKEDLIDQAKADGALPKEEREGWILTGIKGMSEDVGIERYQNPGQSSRSRGEVLYIEMWEADGRIKPENTSEKGYNGILRTFAYGKEWDGVEIREPRDFWGPAGGPHTLYGTYYVPDDSMPLSVLQATWGQARDLNVIAKANNESGAHYKEALFTDSEELAQKIAEAKHQHVFVHDSLDKDRLISQKFGGISDQAQFQELRLEKSLEDASGLTEAMKGGVTGDGTATENAIASSSSSSRKGYVVRKFYAATEENLRKVLWYMLNDDKFVIRGGPELDRLTGMKNAMIRGGTDDGMVDDFNDLELSIEVGSMGRKTQQEREARAMMKLQAVQALAQANINLPNLAVTDVAGDIAADLDYPELPARINVEIGAMVAAMMMGQQGGMEPAQSTPQPQGRLKVTQGIASSKGASSVLPQHAASQGPGSSATGVQNSFSKNGKT